MRNVWTSLLFTAAALGPMSVEAGRPGPAPCNCGPRPAVPMAPLPVMPVPGPVSPGPVLLPPVGMAPPMVPSAPPVTLVPQTQTCLRAETTTVLRPVTTKERHQQAYTVDVPVTTHRQVTVDEGGYQQVWVPKLVTKSVPETTVRQEVRYRTVEREVTHNVPQTVTRLVPQQVTAFVPAPRTASIADPCHYPPAETRSHSSNPSTGGSVPNPYPGSGSSSGGGPEARTVAPDSSAQWQKIPQKVTESETKSAVELQSYEIQSASPPRRLFSPVPPTAATVWQAQSAFR